MNEFVQQWKALPEVERREFDDKAAEEQKRYLAVCVKERQERGGAGAARGDPPYADSAFNRAEYLTCMVNA